jgi:hypothetical protein
MKESKQERKKERKKEREGWKKITVCSSRACAAEDFDDDGATYAS